MADIERTREAIDLGALGLDRGGLLLLKRALRRLPVGGRLAVSGAAPREAVK